MSGTISYTYQGPPEGVTEAPGFPLPMGFVIRSTDGAYIPCDLDNRDYQEFLAWVEAGNTAPSGWTGPKNP